MSSLAQELVEITEQGMAAVLATVVEADGSAKIEPGSKVTVTVMREAAIRRIAVVDGNRAVGVVSLGDLALEEDPGSALADISAAQPNN